MTYAHQLLLLAQEHGEGGGGEEENPLTLILPPLSELLWGIICFAIVLFLLSRFAFPRLRQAVEDREKKIQEDLESAERSKREAEQQKQ